MKSKTFPSLFFFTFLLLLLMSQSLQLLAQSEPNCVDGRNQLTGELCANPIFIKTNLFFINYPSDARSMGMGGIGIATEAGLTSINMNSSNLAFADARFGIQQSYVPVYRFFRNNLRLFNASSYFKINDANVIAASLRYFGHRGINFVGSQAEDNFFDLEGLISYNRKLGNHFAVGVSLKYIYLKIWDRRSLGEGSLVKPAQTMATDISFTYQKPIQLGNIKGKWTSGLAVSNIGNKIHYLVEESPRWAYSIPTNLGIGNAFTMEFAKDHSLTLSADINRLLMPTPSSLKGEGDPNVWDYQEKGLLEGMLGSFTDAPNGFEEEWNENQYSFGLEYHYKAFYVRHGYYLQHATKGNRKFMANGLGVKGFGIGLDFSYILSLNQADLPESYRMTLSYDFGAVDKK